MISRFVNYYLRQGAENIVIYFDGVCPDFPERQMPSVSVVEFDEGLKSKNATGDPKDMLANQELIYTMQHSKNESEWMLVVDADEFVYVPGMRLNEAFLEVGSDVQSVRFPVGEAIWGPGDLIDEEFACQYFRLPAGKIVSLILPFVLYGGNAGLFRRGLLGHVSGKHAIRCGAAVDKVSAHFSKFDGKPLGVWVHQEFPKLKYAFVAHFDAIGCERWIEKWRMRHADEVRVFGMGRGRVAQAHVTKRAIAEGTEAQLFQSLYSLGFWKLSILSALGLLRHSNIFALDPGAEVNDSKSRGDRVA
ncbi:MAG: glycosyltransferase family 2 protein [Pseudomonadota bacterium]